MRQSIGFRYEAPSPPDRFGDRLRREFNDPKGSARLRWLSFSALLLVYLGKTSLTPWINAATKHPLFFGGVAALLIWFLPLLMVIPNNIFNLELHIFEHLRMVAYVLLGGRTLYVFTLAFALEGVALGYIWHAVCG